MSDVPFKPMLATDVDLSILRFPVLASPKLDGIRAVVRDGVVYSRSNKPIPNKFIQERFGQLNTLDGELIVGLPTAKDCYTQTTSHVMSHDKRDFPVTYYVFDCIRDLAAEYTTRQRWMAEACENTYAGVNILEQALLHNLDELAAFEANYLEAGYEGVILRNPDAPYKQGRSTTREQYLLKVKQFQDAEAVVIGFEERMRNDNEATTNELGRTKRSSHKAGKVGRGDLGALVCRTPAGVEFSIGTGLDDAARENLWAIRDQGLVGRLVKYKFFPVGVKEAPRHPVFLGWRDRSDMS